MDHIKLPYVDRRAVAERSDLTTPSRETTLENRFGGELKLPPKRFIFSVDSADDRNPHGLNAKVRLKRHEPANLV